jgi:hypothetical protein
MYRTWCVSQLKLCGWKGDKIWSAFVWIICRRVRKISLAMSLSLSAWKSSVPTALILVEFDIRQISKSCREISSFIKIWQYCQVLYMKTNESISWKDVCGSRNKRWEMSNVSVEMLKCFELRRRLRAFNTRIFFFDFTRNNFICLFILNFI